MEFATPYQTYIPLPSDSGGKHQDHEAVLSLVPVHIVTHASQLPKEFLFPSPKSPLIVGFDCEGVHLCRYGTLCIMQLAFSDAIYLVDAIQGGEELMKACKPALESSFITKVIHDCKRDSEALYYQFGIKLHNVLDTQIAYSLIEEQKGRRKSSDGPISFVGLLADPQYCGISYFEKKDIRVLLTKASVLMVLASVCSLFFYLYHKKSGEVPSELIFGLICVVHSWMQNPKFWTYRPLSEMMVRAAVDDVRFLPYIHDKIMEKLNEQLLYQLAIRGALYCRYFCVNDKGFADWPPIPTIPDSIKAKGNALEEEISSVINVPSGKMGCIIGKRGATILAIKKSCKADILIGGERGIQDKVFIIGPLKEVRKAEAIIRGKIC
ncbi:hypothetical protein PTKIN_Ptkin13bG0112400 [Pterospermum kingtungense]